jgi:hypothetical protein
VNDTVKPALEHSLLLQVLEQVTAVDGKVGVLQGQVNLVLGEHQRAADKRQQMYDKLSKIDTIESDLKRIMPLVDKHEEHHNQRVGALGLGRLIWGIIAGGAGAGILSVVEWLTGHPPHHP